MSFASKQDIHTVLQNGYSCHNVAAQTHIRYSTKSRLYFDISHTLPGSVISAQPSSLVKTEDSQFTKVTSTAANTAPQLKKLSKYYIILLIVRIVLERVRLKSAVKQNRPFLSRTPWQCVAGAPVQNSGGLEEDGLVK